MEEEAKKKKKKKKKKRQSTCPQSKIAGLIVDTDGRTVGAADGKKRETKALAMMSSSSCSSSSFSPSLPKPKTHHRHHFNLSISSSRPCGRGNHFLRLQIKSPTLVLLLAPPPRVLTEAVGLVELDPKHTTSNEKEKEKEEDISRKVDRNGRFCSPRAARELALLTAYAACLNGSDPIRLFDQRLNAKRDPGYVFDQACLLDYDHMSFGGAPVEVGTEEEADELMLKNEKASTNEAKVLSAPLKLVYNRSVLRLTRDILGSVAKRWNDHVLVINRIVPSNWKDEPAARILELCILHLAMAEITDMGTRHQIVINEAVDLAKRFCDGCAPRIINGCLRTFLKELGSSIEKVEK